MIFSAINITKMNENYRYKNPESISIKLYKLVNNPFFPLFLQNNFDFAINE